ncbi:MAG: carboxypeptidase regulatory-like domain-containing protein, partial [Bryobacteraceae bacterium]
MNARRVVRVLTAGLLLSAGASAYYHFVRFTTTYGPYTPIFDRFDLAALPGHTVQFFITDQAPSAVASGDTMPAIVSELRAAAKVWTDVASSDLRLAYGGIATADTAQATPGIDVTFSDDIPPGLIALGGPTSRADMVTNASGSFVPIQRSVLMLRRDLSTRPSWSERFFLTLVHEFGHTLGLQHTLASATMATEITRSSTKASPLGGDDIAGISILYPTSAFLASTGTISGVVTLSGAGVNLASVVALSTTGPAISTLSNPDGTYRLAGLPPGQYSVYVHALPPALAGENSPANIIAPSDPNGKIPAGPSFATQFSSGTVSVAAGKTASDLNFAVQPRPDGDQISAVQTYSFFGSNAVKPAFFNKTVGQGSLIAAGLNLTANGGPTPGLGLHVLNGADSVDAVRGYVSDPVNWIQANITLNADAPDGPRHVLFTTPTDLYVLPAAYRVATAPPPVITGTQPTGDGGLSIAGTNIGPGTRILFDGIPAATRTASEGLLVVVPPAAPRSYRARIVALNDDGQSSLFVQGDSPSTFTFDSQADIAGMSIAPASLPAGTDTFIEINASGGNFAQGDTRVGFGTSDLLVRKIWVFSPTRLLAEVSVAPGAQSSTSTVTVVTGLRHFYQTYSFSVQQPNRRQVSFAIPSAAPGYGWVYP